MSTYTTGDIAKRCHVSVRTVQYYDRQGIFATKSDVRCKSARLHGRRS